MRYEKNRKILGIDELTLQKAMKLLALPIITIILIIIIVVADKIKSNPVAVTPSDATEVSTDATEQSSSIEPDNNKYIQDFDSYGLQKDAVPEIAELVSKYQEAKLSADAKKLYEVFGRTDTEGLVEMQEKLTSEAEVYEAYEDTVCYTTKGVEDNSYIVYISCKLKFAGIDTPAPMLTWAYVVCNDGIYTMKEPDKLTSEEQEKVDEISLSEDVKVLDSQMRTELAKAVLSDAKLGSLYDMLAEGQTASDSNSEIAEEASQESTESVADESVEEAVIHIEGNAGE